MCYIVKARFIIAVVILEVVSHLFGQFPFLILLIRQFVARLLVKESFVIIAKFLTSPWLVQCVGIVQRRIPINVIFRKHPFLECFTSLLVLK
jgi:hypothetical protein